MTAEPAPGFSPLTSGQTKFTGGVLHRAVSKNTDNLFRKIDVAALGKVYAEVHEPGYAEPEFCGKYIDTAMALYGYTGDDGILKNAAAVVEAIVKHQRADGFLGTYRPGAEFESFGVWNQQFTILGLLSYYRVTTDQAALDCAQRCAKYIVANFMRDGGPDLLRAGNQGI